MYLATCFFFFFLNMLKSAFSKKACFKYHCLTNPHPITDKKEVCLNRLLINWRKSCLCSAWMHIPQGPPHVSLPDFTNTNSLTLEDIAFINSLEFSPLTLTTSISHGAWRKLWPTLRWLSPLYIIQYILWTEWKAKKTFNINFLFQLHKKIVPKDKELLCDYISFFGLLCSLLRAKKKKKSEANGIKLADI